MRYFLIILFACSFIFAGQKEDCAQLQDTSIVVTEEGDTINVIKVYTLVLDTVLIDVDLKVDAPNKEKPEKPEKPDKKEKPVKEKK